MTRTPPQRKIAGCTSGSRFLPDEVDGLAVFLDIDGTLIDIADTPDGIVVPAGLPVALTGLARTLGGAVALVTGRSVATVERLFPSVPVAINGLHGAEWRDAEGRAFAPEPTAEFMAAKVSLRDQAADWPGVCLLYPSPSPRD